MKKGRPKKPKLTNNCCSYKGPEQAPRRRKMTKKKCETTLFWPTSTNKREGTTSLLSYDQLAEIQQAVIQIYNTNN
uniref:Uncharacterized protein n=1 Tax=Romanomermis culicivorax TaxID=13658 RepID=A0A915KFL0_ROMCU